MTLRRKTLIIACTAILAVLIGLKKIVDLAAPPVGEKRCDFVFPSAADQTKPTTITMGAPEHLPLAQSGGVINDASCLNKTAVYGVVRVSTIDDVRRALLFARDNKLKVTSAGQRHSMGGQSFVKDGLVLDMRGFNQISVDSEKKILHAQAGATWEQIQQMLDTRGLAVKAMQSINIFTVGGTLSVNAHGIAHDPGQVAPTVRSLRVMLGDGEIRTASPTENPELFRSVLGGYGLFGVILDADLDVVDNEIYAWTTEYVDYRDFPRYYREHVSGNDRLGLFYARLSVAPQSYLRETAVHSYTRTPFDGAVPSLQPEGHTWINRLVINFSKTGGIGRWLRWTLEKHVEPRIHVCTRNQAMSRKELCLVSRNQEMFDAMGYLKNRLPDTDILQEYFVPQDRMPEFVDGLRTIVTDDGANLLNVTIRIVHKDTVTALPYAKDDRFAFVLYFNQKLNEKDGVILRQTTSDLVDLATRLGGTFYVPYQLHYSPEQLRAAYPEADGFFARKTRYDPSGLFTNTFFEKYGK